MPQGKVISKYRKKCSSKEVTSSVNKRDDKQDTANFCCLSKSETLWKGCSYVEEWRTGTGQYIDSENAKLIIILENSRNMKGELLFDVKLQKLKLTFLFLKQLKGAFECVVRRTEKRITVTRTPISYFLRICYYVLKTVADRKWSDNRNLMQYQRFGKQSMIICNQQIVELLQIDSNAIKVLNLAWFSVWAMLLKKCNTVKVCKEGKSLLFSTWCLKKKKEWWVKRQKQNE